MATKQILIALAIAAALIFIFPLVFKKTGFSTLIAKERDLYGTLIELQAQRYGVPANRIKAMIIAESSVEANATGAAGERGLMQIMPGALSDVNRAFALNFTWSDMYSPEKNVETGTAYLSLQYRQTGDIDLATQAYNAGLAGVTTNPNAGMDYLKRVQSIEAGIA